MNEKLYQLINTQVTNELISAEIYRAMAYFCEYYQYNNIAKFFKEKVKEETEHSEEMAKFLNDRNEFVIVGMIPSSKANFSDILEVFKDSLAHEKEVTKNINDILDQAKLVKDYPAEELYLKFASEQVEEENEFTNLIQAIINNLAFDPKLYNFERDINTMGIQENFKNKEVYKKMFTCVIKLPEETTINGKIFAKGTKLRVFSENMEGIDMEKDKDVVIEPPKEMPTSVQPSTGDQPKVDAPTPEAPGLPAIAQSASDVKPEETKPTEGVPGLPKIAEGENKEDKGEEGKEDKKDEKGEEELVKQMESILAAYKKKAKINEDVSTEVVIDAVKPGSEVDDATKEVMKKVNELIIANQYNESKTKVFYLSLISELRDLVKVN